MPRIALGLAYDGSDWRGWQTQPFGKTVQDALEDALEHFLGQRVATLCAGRTDAAVHALCQVVHLDTHAERPEESWVRGLNTWLPRSISVQWARPVDDTFHARFSALSRSYVYLLRSNRVRSPFLRGRVGWVFYDLDLQAMQQAAQRLLGEHDFTSFRSSECQAASPVRTLRRLQISRHGQYFIFRFQANAFLHHMVRNLMGSLVLVGRGRKPVGWIDQVLQARDRTVAAATFAPDGLYLAEVEYPAQYGLPMTATGQSLESLLAMFDP
jgi:tRNA pseudouridine38-40 synthase